jgi:hypothetical protein
MAGIDTHTHKVAARGVQGLSDPFRDCGPSARPQPNQAKSTALSNARGLQTCWALKVRVPNTENKALLQFSSYKSAIRQFSNSAALSCAWRDLT